MSVQNPILTGIQGSNPILPPIPPTPPNPLPLATVFAATVGKLSYNPTYYNGPNNDGVGATLIATQNGILRDTSGVGVIDYNYIPQIGEVILVKNETAGLRNGLYLIVDPGSISTPYSLIRFSDYDISSELFPLLVNVLFGLTLKLRNFSQVIVDPIIGTINLIFSVVSNTFQTTNTTLIDTATTESLPSNVYQSGSNVSVPGLGATLTATSNGALADINGIEMKPGVRFLARNESNPAYNGYYTMINKGSSTTKWSAVRTGAYAYFYIKTSNYFLVSNTNSTLIGKQYFTVPNTPALTNATIGTAPININEYGGGYNQIQDEGSNLPLRNTIDFQGAGVDVSDDGTKTIVSIPGGGGSIVGENYVLVYATDDWRTNGDELLAAYALAKTLTPNGSPISFDNRVTVVCYPGYYDLRDKSLDITEDYIDFVSLTGNCDVKLKNSLSFSINIIAPNDVFIKGIDTLWINQPFLITTVTFLTHIFEKCKGGDGSFGYYLSGDATWGNRVEMGGTFIDCEAQSNSFGSNYIASGNFTNCIALDSSFGGSDSSIVEPGNATGTFINCVAGQFSFGVGGTCSGNFLNCKGDDHCFGYSSNDVSGAYFENCIGRDSCFLNFNGVDLGGTTVTATLINCTARDYSFFANYIGGSEITFTNCIANDFSFNYSVNSPISVIKNTFYSCKGNDDCFNFNVAGYELQTYYNCEGKDFCFGNNGTSYHYNCLGNDNCFQNGSGASNGYYENCKAKSNSFGDITSFGTYIKCIGLSNCFGSINGIANGNYKYCTVKDDSFASAGTLNGKLYYCQMENTLFNTVSGAGRTFYCVGNNTPNNQ